MFSKKQYFRNKSIKYNKKYVFCTTVHFTKGMIYFDDFRQQIKLYLCLFVLKKKSEI